MKQHLLILLVLLQALSGCDGQTRSQSDHGNSATLVGGGCDGCELMFVGMPKHMDAADTSAGWHEKGQKLLVTGTVFKSDGKTPAPDVILYYWQTDGRGYYSPAPGLDPKAKRHGHIRGWIKTDPHGKYSIYTIRPAPYPNESIPAHIHPSIKEPAIDNEYYIDDFIFDDDPLLTGPKRKALENRGGSGVLRILLSGDLQVAEHNIVLGLNIPNYPVSIKTEKKSGLNIGEDNPSFIPFHAWGPDKGTRTCPVCQYGRYHGIIYFVGNHPDWHDIRQWLAFLEQESKKRSKYLKVYFVYGNEQGYAFSKRQKELEALGKTLNLTQVALTFVPSLKDTESEVNLNKINPETENTFILFKHISIIDKFIDLKANSENFSLISSRLDQSKGDYFELHEPEHK